MLTILGWLALIVVGWFAIGIIGGLIRVRFRKQCDHLLEFVFEKPDPALNVEAETSEELINVWFVFGPLLTFGSACVLAVAVAKLLLTHPRARAMPVTIARTFLPKGYFSSSSSPPVVALEQTVVDARFPVVFSTAVSPAVAEPAAETPSVVSPAAETPAPPAEQPVVAPPAPKAAPAEDVANLG